VTTEEFRGLKALTDSGPDKYRGYERGLYPGGLNVPPAVHRDVGVKRAAEIVPLTLEGRPDPNGRIVLLSIGMSNASMEFTVFQRTLRAGVNPNLTVVNGAQDNKDARATANRDSKYWEIVENRLNEAGVSASQVQVIWLKTVISEERQSFPENARRLKTCLQTIVQIVGERYPNTRIVYLSSRTYGGYATISLSPEPYAYESGFAVKWLIEDQIRGEFDLDAQSGGERQIPWLAWGPYLWTQGAEGRDDGVTWSRENVEVDGTHPSMSGRLKVARLLAQFFFNEDTAKSWFPYR
jgi:hypothetical protein